jgi:hypothetical protein
MSAVAESRRVRFVSPTLRKKREGWGTRRLVSGLEPKSATGNSLERCQRIASGTKGCGGGFARSFSAHVRWCEHGAPRQSCTARSRLEGEGCGIPHLAKNERDAPNFLYAALDRTACAALLKESRMKFREPRKLHRKSGMWAPGAWCGIELKDAFTSPRSSKALPARGSPDIAPAFRLASGRWSPLARGRER